jgi:hypothetical protein
MKRAAILKDNGAKNGMAASLCITTGKVPRNAYISGCRGR